MGAPKYLLSILVFITIAYRSGLTDKPSDFKCDSTSIATKMMGPMKNRVSDPNAKITLQLFTRERGSTKIATNGDISNIRYSDFRFTRKTVVICHGYLGHAEIEWINPMAKAYLAYQDVNVIVVDWGVLAKQFNYVQAAYNVQHCAQQVVELLEGAVGIFGGDARQWEPMHLIGFSLGAHVMGMLADKLKSSRIGWRVERITGLDPAAPCFERNEMKLDKGDADFVDIIHTNGNKQLDLSFGIKERIGHVDFYVNGGQVQPGCKKLTGWWTKLSVTTYVADKYLRFDTAQCSHNRAPEYFIESLEVAASGTGWHLLGTRWESQDLCSALDFTESAVCKRDCVAMGINATRNEGVYFVPAARRKPFYVLKHKDRKSIVKQLKETLKQNQ